jgi:31-O-methyltransferase
LDRSFPPLAERPAVSRRWRRTIGARLPLARRLAHAARLLHRCRHHLANWPEVWNAWRALRPLPTLRLRSGARVASDDLEEAILVLDEIVRGRCYTGPDFYQPRPGDVVLDVGANIGLFPLHLATLAPEVRVHCFEPSPRSHALLRQNLESNGLIPWTTPHALAVFDHNGPVVLRRAERSGHRSLLGTTLVSAGDGDEVEAIDLAEAVRRSGADRVALLKLDVEGAEIEIVEGADATVWARIDRVVLEFHDRIRPGCLARVSRVLRAHGFTRLAVRTGPDDRDAGILEASRRP